jgi:hypothetical protein
MTALKSGLKTAYGKAFLYEDNGAKPYTPHQF